MHTDRGGEFLSRRWRKALRDFGAVASALATVNGDDNAVAENFFATFECPKGRVTKRSAWRG